MGDTDGEWGVWMGLGNMEGVADMDGIADTDGSGGGIYWKGGDMAYFWNAGEVQKVGSV